MGLLYWLFDTSMGSPGPHGTWSAWLQIVYHSSNAISTLCMVIVPVIVVRHLPRRDGGVSERQLWMILAVYLAFAGCRFARVLEVAGPPYHLTTILDFIAAMVSVYSVVYMPRLLRYIMLLPSLNEINELNNELSAGILEAEADRQESEASNASLIVLLERAQGTLETLGWCAEKSRALDDIRAVLVEIQPKEVLRGT